MVNDCGNIKWTSIMLPEHITMLNEWYESENDVEKPILSEDKLQEMEETIQKAIQFRQLVCVSYFENKRILKIKGMIKGATANKLEIETENGLNYLSLLSIVDTVVSEY